MDYSIIIYSLLIRQCHTEYYHHIALVGFMLEFLGWTCTVYTTVYVEHMYIGTLMQSVHNTRVSTFQGLALERLKFYGS